MFKLTSNSSHNQVSENSGLPSTVQATTVSYIGYVWKKLLNLSHFFLSLLDQLWKAPKQVEVTPLSGKKFTLLNPVKSEEFKHQPIEQSFEDNEDNWIQQLQLSVPVKSTSDLDDNVTVPDNGNCLFNALALGLSLLKKDPQTPQNVMTHIGGQFKETIPFEETNRNLKNQKHLFKAPSALLRKQANNYLRKNFANPKIYEALSNSICLQEMAERDSLEDEKINLETHLAGSYLEEKERLDVQEQLATLLQGQGKIPISTYMQTVITWQDERKRVINELTVLKKEFTKLKNTPPLQPGGSQELTLNLQLDAHAQQIDRLETEFKSFTQAISELLPLTKPVIMDYLKKMDEDRQFCGPAHIVALSKLYQIPIQVKKFTGTKIASSITFGEEFLPNQVLKIANVNNNHYDLYLPRNQ